MKTVYLSCMASQSGLFELPCISLSHFMPRDACKFPIQGELSAISGVLKNGIVQITS